MKNKEEAQRRVDRIQAFKEELNDLEEQKVLRLSPEQKDSARDRHINVRGKIALSYYSSSYMPDKNKKNKPVLEGHIREVFSSKLFVPTLKENIYLT